jgi:hypothetical protein
MVVTARDQLIGVDSGVEQIRSDAKVGVVDLL